MLRKLVWAFMPVIALTAAGCDYQNGEAEGRATVRKMRQEAQDPLSKAGTEALLRLAPIQGEHQAGKSADWQAGYRKGYTEEVDKP